MSPRRTVAEARQTRAGIVRHGVDVASVEGLDGLTIGRLAADLGLSKSGVLGHFGDKETLQLAVVELATDEFWRVGVMLSLHTAHRLRRDPAAATRAAQAVARLLGSP